MPDGFLVLRLLRQRYAARVAERAQLGPDRGGVALERGGIHFAARMKQALHAAQRDPIAAQPRFHGVARLGRGGFEGAARGVGDVDDEAVPGEEGNGDADDQDRPGRRLLHPVAELAPRAQGSSRLPRVQPNGFNPLY